LPSWQDSRTNEALKAQRWAFWWNTLGIIVLTATRHLLGTTAEEARGFLSLYPP